MFSYMLAEFEFRPNLRYHPQDVLRGSMRLNENNDRRAATVQAIRRRKVIPLNSQVAETTSQKYINSEMTARRAKAVYGEAAKNYGKEPGEPLTTRNPKTGSSYMLNVNASDGQTRGTTVPMSTLKQYT